MSGTGDPEADKSLRRHDRPRKGMTIAYDADGVAYEAEGLASTRSKASP